MLLTSHQTTASSTRRTGDRRNVVGATAGAVATTYQATAVGGVVVLVAKARHATLGVLTHDAVVVFN